MSLPENSAPAPSAALSVLAEVAASPRDGKPLTLVHASEIDMTSLRKVNRTGLDVGDYGFGDGEWLMRDSQGAYYPVVGDFPVLMYPERLVPKDDAETVDLKLPQYEEAYTEMEHYNAVGNDGVDGLTDAEVKRLMAKSMFPDSEKDNFPLPVDVWVDAPHDLIAQLEAYEYLRPIKSSTFLQMGGKGTHAVKTLIAGADRALLLTPMLGEARFAMALAERAGVADKLYCVIAVGEEIPFKEGSFDTIYSGGCVHHMRTEMAFGEIKRVLNDGGRFSCVEPWKTVLNTCGTKECGKREAGVFCKPIDPVRLEPLARIFSNHRVQRHGPFLRYVFLGLEQFGLKLPLKTMFNIAKVDDKVGSLFGLTSRFGGSMVICGQK